MFLAQFFISYHRVYFVRETYYHIPAWQYHTCHNPTKVRLLALISKQVNMKILKGYISLFSIVEQGLQIVSSEKERLFSDMEIIYKAVHINPLKKEKAYYWRQIVKQIQSYSLSFSPFAASQPIIAVLRISPQW